MNATRPSPACARADRRFCASIFLGTAICLSASPADVHAASWITRLLFSSQTEAVPVRRKENMLGQKVKVFHLQKAQLADLQDPLQHYLDGVKSNGTLVGDSDKNNLILTDTPEMLNRFDKLVKAMDQTFPSADPMGRRMLATQQMMRVIRDLDLGTSLAGSYSSSPAPEINPTDLPSASSPNSTAQAPSAATVSTTASSGSVGRPTRVIVPEPSEDEHRLRVIEDRPSIRAFTIIGWIKDERAGTIVVLNNGGQRYLFRNGRLVEGEYSQSNYVNGISGSIHGEDLVLRDKDEGAFSISLVPLTQRMIP